MHLDEPRWWYGSGRGARLAERLLLPFGEVVGVMAERRFKTAVPYRAGLPVICVGNFTAGGTGKTPLSRFLIDALARRGLAVACLTRGYGGALAGPVWVDAAHHTAREVGDEPLLIAQSARVMVARDRRAGLEAIAAEGGVQAVIMDDGLQNPSLAKDLTLAVVDARRGFGNGRVIPSGPLRARLGFQLGLVDGIVVMGADPPGGSAPVFEDLKRYFNGPVLRGRVEPTGDMADLGGQALIAYAGIADPERFFRLVESFGPAVLTRRPFPDHHAFTEREAAALIAEADVARAVLVTTEKDLARLSGLAGARGELAVRSRAVPIAVQFEERDLVRLDALIDGALKAGTRG